VRAPRMPSIAGRYGGTAFLPRAVLPHDMYVTGRKDGPAATLSEAVGPCSRVG
jgi:hypothetical protein